MPLSRDQSWNYSQAVGHLLLWSHLQTQGGGWWNKPNYKCIHVLVSKTQSLKTQETSQGQLHYMPQCSDQTQNNTRETQDRSQYFYSLISEMTTDCVHCCMLQRGRKSSLCHPHALLPDTHTYVHCSILHMFSPHFLLFLFPGWPLTLLEPWKSSQVHNWTVFANCPSWAPPASCLRTSLSCQDLFGRFICTTGKHVGVNAPCGWLWTVGFMNLWIN